MNRIHLFLIPAALSTVVDCRADLIAHYKFDESSGATTAANEVVGSSTGVVGASVTTGVAGISGSAYSFTGSSTQDDIVDMENASFFPSITSSGQYTFSAWINSSELAGGRNVVVFAGDSADSNSYIDLGTAIDELTPPGQAYMRHRVDTNGPGASSFFGGTDGVVVDGTWHHIAMTADTSTLTIRLYVDGVFASSGALVPGSSGNFPIFNNFEIGRLGRSSPTDGYEGLVDDVQVYDKALSEAEISFLFNNPGETFSEDDTDFDGLADAWEILYFGNIEAFSGDDIGPDADGATNLQEQAAGTNPTIPDTDGDGRTDGAELNVAPLTHPLDPDSDDDQLTDGEEVDIHGTDPNSGDTDADGLPDKWELDNSLSPLSDVGDDGASGDPDEDDSMNSNEYNDGIDSSDPHDADSDDDGLSDVQEDRFGSWAGLEFTGTSPTNPDTDGDGFLDGEENPDLEYVAGVTPGTDPNIADSDLDGFGDKAEFDFGSDPTDFESFPVVARGLVAHYKFDEAAAATTAVNELGNSPGVIGTAVNTGVTGMSGNAYQFNDLATQEGIVDMGLAEFLTDILATKALTFTAWIKSTDVSSGRNVVISAANSAVANSYVDMGIVGEGLSLGSLHGRLRPNGNGNITESFSSAEPNATFVTDDEWHHIALTIDVEASALRIFVDGLQVGADRALVLATLPVFNNFEVGRLGRAVPTDAFEGLVDDIQVYNEALSPARIASLYAMPGVSADEDRDRLDDQWEITFFGSIEAQDGSGDPDDDGFTNEEEETAGTSPVPATAALEVTSVNFTPGGDFIIQFTGEPGTTYQITKSADLDGFVPLTPPVTATTDGAGQGGATVPAAEASEDAEFYRVESQ